MSTGVKLLTADDLLNLPQENARYELIDGVLRKMAPSGKKHGRIAAKITSRLEKFVSDQKLGEVYAAETGFKIASNPDTVRAPDVAFLSMERVKDIGDIDGFIPEAPDLAIEVLSPGDAYSAVEEIFQWLDAGTRMVVVVNPQKKTFTVFRSRNDIRVLSEDDTLSGEEVIAGWKLPIRDIFEES